LRCRSDAKTSLTRQPDFIKMSTFDEISRGYHSIGMPELITYLEKNGFYARREDIEAILRRCDHDANRMISYGEFCHLAGVREARPVESDSQEQAASPEAAKASESQVKGASGQVKFQESNDQLRQGPGEKELTA